ncbi:PepSY domain-containing protein [Cupriavidus sp. PET2-C1]
MLSTVLPRSLTPLPSLRTATSSLSRALLPLLLLLLLLAAPAPAHADKDADRARAAVQSGEILPLTRILEAVSAQYTGDVIGVKLDRDDGVWQYEVKLLLASGSVAKLEYDAKTATLLKAKGRDLEQARKKP